MKIEMATEAGSPDAANEDWCGATARTIVVLDGVSMPADIEQACSHGTPWFVRQLGARLLAAGENMAAPLSTILAGCIGAVADLHPQCDVDSVGAPSAAVAMLRILPRGGEYLVLADATIVIDAEHGVRAITDDRVEASVADVSRTAPGAGALIAQRRAGHRNRPGGYWVAAGSPDAAGHAVTGPAGTIRRAAVMTDGAALIRDMTATPWPAALAMPAGDIIARVRAAEQSDPERTRWPRWKVSDDATAVLVRP